MKTFLLAVSILLLLLPARAANWEHSDGRDSVERAVARVKPALVRIEVVWTDYENGRALKHEAAGSGVIIRKEGFVLTNHHVAGHATRLDCILTSNEEIEAEHIGTDPLADLAVLRLKPEKPRDFPVAAFGDSDALIVGDTVLAMGSPLALSQSVTRGIVSNTKLIMSRALESGGRFTLDGEDVGSLVRWIMHDAQILPGNSGGPLVNLRGDIIGINEIGFGLGGAIPGNLAQNIASELIEHRRVRRAWLGLEVQPLLKSGTATEGALISGVIADSPVAKAGLESGDILLRIDGKPVRIHHAEEMPLFTQLTTGLPIGKPVELIVSRADAEKTLTVTPTERPPVEPTTRELKAWGITARDISFLIAKEMRITDTKGALVTGVREGGPAGAAKPSLQRGDIIRQVAGQPVSSLAELVAVTKKLTAGKTEPTPALVALDRRLDKVLTVVKLGVKELEEPGIEARKASLAAAVQAITRELAEQLNHKGITGVRITQVFPDTTAEKAGLKVGDLIVALDGEKIPVSQPGDEEVFTQMVRQYPVGAKPEFAIWRGADKVTLAIELTAASKPDREMPRYRDSNFEFTARDLTYFDRLNRRLAETNPGVVVTEVAEGSWAAVGELRGSDLIVAVNDQPIANIPALEKTMKRLAQERPRLVVFRVQRGIHFRFLELEPDWNHKEPAPKEDKP